MFLTERDGVRFATHHNPSIADHPSQESDQHKALKERIARAAELGGFTVEIEDRATHGRRRTDVLVRGASGLLVGHEVQLAYASLASVKKRAKLAREDGITPLWATVDPKRDFINHVPWAQTDNFPWKYISEGGNLQIRGGVRSLEMERCNIRNPEPCPVRVRGKCGQLHGKWVPTFPVPARQPGARHGGRRVRTRDHLRQKAEPQVVGPARGSRPVRQQHGRPRH
jgi:hypothetical protein